MKVAIVNNGVRHPNALISLLADKEIELFDMKQVHTVKTHRYDLLMLTGSNRFPIMENLHEVEDECTLVREAKCPVVGICFGAQIVNVAFGGTLRDLGPHLKERSVIKISLTESGSRHFPQKEDFRVYDAHRWAIDELGDGLSVLATSHHGVEIIKHNERPVWGLQFHPEKFVEQSDGDEIFSYIIQSFYTK